MDFLIKLLLCKLRYSVNFLFNRGGSQYRGYTVNNKILWLKECDEVNVTQSLANQTQKNLNSTQNSKIKKKG